ncbi:hypothetical protein [Fredinandcohnia sp. 179-A 10B2 NHS]|uniref:hypothetical protein n=1 Tax=Fredinandcohnia sp. 179-A 10B2 NHS TaxID=3235176 RepID=UPI0039A2B588
MEKFVALLGLLFIIFVIGVIESDDVIHYKNAIVVSDLPANEEVNAPVEEDEALEGLIPTLEMELVDKEVIAGNTVETYREYEVYRNEDDEVIKKVPTDNYEYLEYWR